MGQEELSMLFEKIFSILKKYSLITSVGSKTDELILFPSDKWQYGLGEEILAEVEGLPAISLGAGEQDSAQRKMLGKDILRVLKEKFPAANVVCRVHPPDPKILVLNSDDDM
jgi:hypothetical protein